MRRRRGLIPILILLPLIAVAAYFLMTRFQDSFEAFQSPLEGPLLDGQPGMPIAQQVVYVIVDGLRYDTSLKMPFLNELRENGATAEVRSTPSSFSQPSWTTLVTGARPDINGSPPLNAEYEDIEPIKVDHLFASLRRAGMTSAVAGHYWWEKMVPQDLLQGGFYVEGEDEAADQEVLEHGLTILQSVRPNLLLIHFDQVDLAGHTYGGNSIEYLRAALSADRMIEKIADAMDLDESVLVVVSDHGHIDLGGHGGQDDVVLRQPLVMVGTGIIPGELETVEQADIAPTVAAILGAAPPSATQGHILTDALDMSLEQKTQVLVAMAQQRIVLGNAYLDSIGQGELSDVAPGDAAVARSSIEVQNYESAARLAAYAIEQADSEMEIATEKRLLEERNYRRIFAVVAIILPLYFVYRKRSVRTLLLGFAALVSLAAYHLYFTSTGGVYSLSTITGLEPFLMGTLKATAIGLGAGLVIVVARLWAERERDWVNITASTYGFVFFVLYFLSMQVALGFTYNGFRVTWHLPDFFTAFLEFTGMLQAAMVAALGIVLPVVTLTLNGALPRIVWKVVPHVRGWVVAARRRLQRKGAGG